MRTQTTPTCDCRSCGPICRLAQYATGGDVPADGYTAQLHQGGGRIGSAGPKAWVATDARGVEYLTTFQDIAEKWALLGKVDALFLHPPKSAQGAQPGSKDALYAAVENFIKVKGRHNTAIAYQRLVDTFDAAIAASQPTGGAA